MKKKKKVKMIGKITTVVAIAVFAVAFIGFTNVNLTHLNETQSEQSSADVLQTAHPAEGIPPEQVCMVNDAYMGKKQIPVPVGEKLYYGCCQDCVGKLQHNEAFRIAQDPATGEAVDKSEAFIVLQPGDDSQVLYFTSKATFSQYQQTSE